LENLDGIFRPYVYSKWTLRVSVFFWQFIALINVYLFTLVFVYGVNGSSEYRWPFLLIGSSVELFHLSLKAMRLWGLCCASNPDRICCCCATVHERFFTGTLTHLLITTVIAGIGFESFWLKSDTRQAGIGLLIFITLAWMLGAIQVGLNLFSRWYKYDFPDEEPPVVEPTQTCVSRFTSFPHLHAIAVVAWSLIIIAAVVMEISSIQALYPLDDYHAFIVAVVETYLLPYVISFIFEYQLVNRIVGEKGDSALCGTYDAFLFGPFEPLLLCATLTGIYGFDMREMNGQMERWSSGRSASFISLIVAWAGTATLSVFNFLSPCVPSVFKKEQERSKSGDASTGSAAPFESEINPLGRDGISHL
jgi:hypothetical protein